MSTLPRRRASSRRSRRSAAISPGRSSATAKARSASWRSGHRRETERDAKLAAHAIGTSPLVKTALHGGDPNWGRILAALGRSGARFSPDSVSLDLGSLRVVDQGQPAAYREKDAARVFGRERVPLSVTLGSGPGRAVLLSSDFGHDYVALNADYRS
jgi:glutamate N-acetyltransferase / amino-acid N-acetyltransferase